MNSQLQINRQPMRIIKVVHEMNNPKKNVAAYARVSTLSEEQEESFETQVSYFTSFIESVEHWNFAGVYADHGKSGLSAENRPEFMRMIADAMDGKIDIIFVTSISRFGRNSLEAQTYVHKLKEKGVEVRFERERISSFNPQADLVFNFLVAVAQEESRSISENVRWTYERLAEQGIRHLGNNHVLGYDEIQGVLTPNKDAPIVEWIFQAYAAGMNYNKIRNVLAENKVKTLRGKDTFSRGAIRAILKNEIYKGDRQIQKQPPRDLLTHKPDLTQSYCSYYVENDHDSIVSREVWEKARERREKKEALLQQGIHTNNRSHFLVGDVFCGECGCLMRIRYIYYHGKYQKVWKCTDRIKGKKGNGCKNDVVSDEELLRASALRLSLPWDEGNPPEEKDFEGIRRIDVFKERDLRITLKEE